MKAVKKNDGEMDDFRCIARDYEHRIDKTYKEVTKAWFRYQQAD